MFKMLTQLLVIVFIDFFFQIRDKTELSTYSIELVEILQRLTLKTSQK